MQEGAAGNNGAGWQISYKVSSMKIPDFFKAVSLGVCLLCSGCNGDVMSKEDIEKVISENLNSGSTNQEIITFFENQNWMYSFDRYSNRYQARNPEEDKLPEFLGGNQIYIYVDEKKDLSKLRW